MAAHRRAVRRDGDKMIYKKKVFPHTNEDMSRAVLLREARELGIVCEDDIDLKELARKIALKRI